MTEIGEKQEFPARPIVRCDKCYVPLMYFIAEGEKEEVLFHAPSDCERSTQKFSTPLVTLTQIA